jgi:hypothetical protein
MLYCSTYGYDKACLMVWRRFLHLVTINEQIIGNIASLYKILPLEETGL